jgi:hypothetical protein
MIDIFAWIVLLILVASGIAIFFIADSLTVILRQIAIVNYVNPF